MNMRNIKINIFPGAYDNQNGFYNAINYVLSKNMHGAYGCWGDSQSCTRQFQQNIPIPTPEVEKNLWHFCISIQPFVADKYELFGLADHIASIFKNQYQIIFAFDNSTPAHPHLHFLVNTFSFYPDTPILSLGHFLDYLEKMKTILKRYTGITQIDVYFKEMEDCYYV